MAGPGRAGSSPEASPGVMHLASSQRPDDIGEGAQVHGTQVRGGWGVEQGTETPVRSSEGEAADGQG